MQGIITSFRRGRRTQHTSQMIIKVDNINSKEKAQSLLNKTVSWQSPGKKEKIIKGIIKTTHGNNGLVRVHFEKGMPGQSISKKVIIQ